MNFCCSGEADEFIPLSLITLASVSNADLVNSIYLKYNSSNVS